jgi:MoaA/NifB/PqqE/SkfB family radical SAM enzyme
MKTVDLSKGEQVTLFNTLAIETSSACNRTCAFCPNGYFERPDVLMPTSLITKLLLELQALKYCGRIEFYMYNEPTKDKRLPEILCEARRRVPGACLMINTNGDYFHGPLGINYLFKNGLNQMQINVYSHAKRFQELREWVTGLGLDQKASLYQNIGPWRQACQVIAKYTIVPNTKDSDLEGPNHLSNRAGNIPGFRAPLTQPLAKSCTRPFRLLNINYKGDGLLCCNDYGGEVTFGNANERSLVEIWNHPVLNTYRARLQSKDRHTKLCDVCDFKGGPYLHMVDTLVGFEEHVKAFPAPESKLSLVSISKRLF